MRLHLVRQWKGRRRTVRVRAADATPDISYDFVRSGKACRYTRTAPTPSKSTSDQPPLRHHCRRRNRRRNARLPSGLRGRVGDDHRTVAPGFRRDSTVLRVGSTSSTATPPTSPVSAIRPSPTTVAWNGSSTVRSQSTGTEPSPGPKTRPSRSAWSPSIPLGAMTSG